uniref:Uncharacterized protein n=1 Tax=Physcomitrium patens TaxID=3218 RepID=A0A2K1IBW1_PHYPA|nr:hypothetical protein PHYPA_030246 [Physcomitrium patens]
MKSISFPSLLPSLLLKLVRILCQAINIPMAKINYLLRLSILSCCDVDSFG